MDTKTYLCGNPGQVCSHVRVRRGWVWRGQCSLGMDLFIWEFIVVKSRVKIDETWSGRNTSHNNDDDKRPKVKYELVLSTVEWLVTSFLRNEHNLEFLCLFSDRERVHITSQYNHILTSSIIWVFSSIFLFCFSPWDSRFLQSTHCTHWLPSVTKSHLRPALYTHTYSSLWSVTLQAKPHAARSYYKITLSQLVGTVKLLMTIIVTI